MGLRLCSCSIAREAQRLHRPLHRYRPLALACSMRSPSLVHAPWWWWHCLPDLLDVALDACEVAEVDTARRRASALPLSGGAHGRAYQ